jgi:hypothetical protein
MSIAHARTGDAAGRHFQVIFVEEQNHENLFSNPGFSRVICHSF